MSKVPINPDEIEIRVREVKEKPGKPIVVVFGDCKVLTDVRCLGKEGEDCNKCKLKFRCFTNNNLEINFLKELRCQASEELDISLDNLIKFFLMEHDAKKESLDKEISA